MSVSVVRNGVMLAGVGFMRIPWTRWMLIADRENTKPGGRDALPYLVSGWRSWYDDGATYHDLFCFYFLWYVIEYWQLLSDKEKRRIADLCRNAEGDYIQRAGDPVSDYKDTPLSRIRALATNQTTQVNVPSVLRR